MSKAFIISGIILAGLGVVVGAFGAHALKDLLEGSGRVNTFETAVKYQFYHALGLILLGMIMMNHHHSFFTYSGYSFLMGTVIFSGSLYILCLTGITKFGAITPIGGLLMILGWIFMLIGVYRTV